MKPEKTTKKEKTVDDLLSEAISEGYEKVISLNDSASSKKVFRAAMGHGYQEFGPIGITEKTIDDWVKSLLERSKLSFLASSKKTLEKSQLEYDKAKDNLSKAAKPAEIKKLTELTEKHKNRLGFAQKIVDQDNKSIEVALIDLAQVCARGTHTHDGKLVHANSKLRLFYDPKDEKSEIFIPYICSRNTTNERQISAGYAHKPEASEPALIFHAVFVLEGEITSFSQLLRSKNPIAEQAFINAGISLDAVRVLQEVFSNTGEKVHFVDRSIPQQQWRTSEKDYVAVQTLPSIGVYSALTREKRRHRDESYLPTIQLQVGSGQAQNISIFASSTSGFLSMWKCEPPIPPITDLTNLIDKCWGGSLVAFKSISSKARDIEFEKDITLRPNTLREKFMIGFAKKHANKALRDLLRARDMFDEHETDWTEAVAKLNAAERDFVTGKSKTDDQVNEIYKSVLTRLPQQSLKEHTVIDKETYLKAIKSFIKTAC